MNGGSGIQPTVELATTNGAYPYPVMFGNTGGGFGGFGGDSAIWLIVLLALIWGNNGNNGFGFGGNNFDNGYAWLSNGQKEIMSNTNNGFDTLHLSNQLEGNRDAINGLSNQLCNSTASINSNISNGFYNSEIAENNRQLSYLQSFNSLGSQLANCCCENRLGIANLNSTILAENCADRAALQEGVRDIITNATSNTQAVLDKLCQLELDNKDTKINDLQRELLMKDLQASQIQQTATLREGQAQANTDLFNLLNSCPVPSTPVFGRTPIFTCNNNGGCGCNGNYYTTI